MQIGELARRTGVAPSALRYYEELGLLPAPARRSGRRVYQEEALDRVAFIRFAQMCGFQLDEVAALIDGTVSRRFQELAVRKMQEVDALIESAHGMKRFLEASLDCRCISADECGRRIRAHAT